MIDFIDETAEQLGTEFSRENMMALQGFIKNTITFNPDGSITEKNSNGEELTISSDDDGNIVETFKGKKTIAKKTSFAGNVITEEVL